MKLKPFDQADQYTIFDNAVLDYIMPELSPNAWKVLCFVIRKTKGWQKDSDNLSFTQIQQGTGIKSSATVTKAIDELEQGNYILIYRYDDYITSNEYRLNLALEIEVGTLENEVPINEGTTETKALNGKGTLENEVPKRGGTLENEVTKQIKTLTPNGVGSQLPTERVRDGPKTKMMNRFVELTGIPLPTNSSDKKYWWSRMGELFNIAQKDEQIGLRLIDDTCGELDTNGLTISDPGSLVKTARALMRQKNTTVRFSAK